MTYTYKVFLKQALRGLRPLKYKQDGKTITAELLDELHNRRAMIVTDEDGTEFDMTIEPLAQEPASAEVPLTDVPEPATAEAPVAESKPVMEEAPKAPGQLTKAATAAALAAALGASAVSFANGGITKPADLVAAAARAAATASPAEPAKRPVNALIHSLKGNKKLPLEADILLTKMMGRPLASAEVEELMRATQDAVNGDLGLLRALVQRTALQMDPAVTAR